jgi:hypothetical protein
MTLDPTRADLLAFLRRALPDSDEFDREEAVYWFAAGWHGGQWTNLYEALCASPYSPGPLANGPRDETCLDALVAEFAG